MSNFSNNREIEKERDIALIAQIADKDEKALADLYDIHSRLVYSLIIQIVSHVADAEEVTQEVFFKIWQNAKSFDKNKGNPLSWIITISRRLAIDRLRSKGYKFQKRNSVLDQSLLDNLQSENRLINSELDPIQKGEVANSVSQLSEKHLEVINLAFYDSMSHSMIAEHLDIPLGTVKSRIREAMKNLRMIFEKRGVTK